MKKKVPKARNPMVQALNQDRRYTEKVAKSGEERQRQRDGWERQGKHKGRRFDHGFQVGDEIKHDGEKGMVKNPLAPLGMVGIAVDGEQKVVDPQTLELLKEHISGLILLSK